MCPLKTQLQDQKNPKPHEKPYVAAPVNTSWTWDWPLPQLLAPGAHTQLSSNCSCVRIPKGGLPSGVRLVCRTWELGINLFSAASRFRVGFCIVRDNGWNYYFGFGIKRCRKVAGSWDRDGKHGKVFQKTIRDMERPWGNSSWRQGGTWPWRVEVGPSCKGGCFAKSVYLC